MGLAEHLQAAAGAHASTASSLQAALAQATTLTQTLAQDVQGPLQQLSERLGAASSALAVGCSRHAAGTSPAQIGRWRSALGHAAVAEAPGPCEQGSGQGSCVRVTLDRVLGCAVDGGHERRPAEKRPGCRGVRSCACACARAQGSGAGPGQGGQVCAQLGRRWPLLLLTFWLAICRLLMSSAHLMCAVCCPDAPQATFEG